MDSPAAKVSLDFIERAAARRGPPLFLAEPPVMGRRTVPYCILAHSAKGVGVRGYLFNHEEEEFHIEHGFRISFYHSVTRKFFGNTYRSNFVYPEEELETPAPSPRRRGRKQKSVDTEAEKMADDPDAFDVEDYVNVKSVDVSFEDSVYFHSKISDPTVYLVVELVSAAVGAEGNRISEVGVGWTILKPWEGEDVFFDDLEGLENEPPKLLKAPIYEGTPRALFASDPVHLLGHLIAVDGASFLYSIHTHKALRGCGAVRLFGENTFVDARDRIPGISRAPEHPPLWDVLPPAKGFKMPPARRLLDNTKIPHGVYYTLLHDIALDDRYDSEVSRLRISLPTGKKFESLLIQQFAYNALLGTGKPLLELKNEEPPEITIDERRVTLTVHNGWTAISEPVHVSLVTADRGASLLSDETTFLKGALADEECYVVAELSFAVSYKDLNAAQHSKKKASVIQRVINLGWTAIPLATSTKTINRGKQEVALIHAGHRSPSGRLCFRTPNFEGSGDIVLRFSLAGGPPGDKINTPMPSGAPRVKPPTLEEEAEEDEAEALGLTAESETREETIGTEELGETTDTLDTQAEPETGETSQRGSRGRRMSSGKTKKERRKNRTEERSEERPKSRRRSVHKEQESPVEATPPKPRPPKPKSRRPVEPPKPIEEPDLSHDQSTGALSEQGSVMAPVEPRAHKARTPREVMEEREGSVLKPHGETTPRQLPVLPKQTYRVVAQMGSFTPSFRWIAVSSLDHAIVFVVSVPGSKTGALVTPRALLLRNSGVESENPDEPYGTFSLELEPENHAERMRQLGSVDQTQKSLVTVGVGPLVIEESMVPNVVGPTHLSEAFGNPAAVGSAHRVFTVSMFDADSLLLMASGSAHFDFSDDVGSFRTSIDLVSGRPAHGLHCPVAGRIDLTVSYTASPYEEVAAAEAIRRPIDLSGHGGQEARIVDAAPAVSTRIQRSSEQLAKTLGIAKSKPDDRDAEARRDRLDALAREFPVSVASDICSADEVDESIVLDQYMAMLAASRKELRAQALRQALRRSLTYHQDVTLSIGVPHLVEIPFQNPFPHDAAFDIAVDGAMVTPMTNESDWASLKFKQGLKTPLRAELFDVSGSDPFLGKEIRMRLRANEEVYVPFVFKSCDLLFDDPKIAERELNTLFRGLYPFSSKKMPAASTRVPGPHVVTIRTGPGVRRVQGNGVVLAAEDESGTGRVMRVQHFHIQPTNVRSLFFDTVQTCIVPANAKRKVYMGLSAASGVLDLVPQARVGARKKAVGAEIKSSGRITEDVFPAFVIDSQDIDLSKLARLENDGGDQPIYVRAPSLGEGGVTVFRPEDSRSDALRVISVDPPPSGSDVSRLVPIFVYSDRTCLRLMESILLVVDSCAAHAVSGVLGRVAESNLTVRGGDQARSVACVTSDERVLVSQPSGPFTLTSGGQNVVRLEYVPNEIGTNEFLVQIVELNSHALVGSWIAVCQSATPRVTKAFELTLVGTKATNKKISYTNPYATSKTFRLATTHPDLVVIKDPILTLEAGGSQYIGLRFNARSATDIMERPGFVVHVFVREDASLKQEECMQITIKYK